MSSMFGMLGAILRGVRSRALLSAGSVLLTALAVASAVLGPIFAGAVTNSYLVTRLREAPPALTGLSRVFTPDCAAVERRCRARRRRRHGLAQRGTVGADGRDRAVGAADGAARLRGVLGARRRLRGPRDHRPVPREDGRGAAAREGGRAGRCHDRRAARPRRLRAARAPGAGPSAPRAQRRSPSSGTYVTPADATDWLVPRRLTITNEMTSDTGPLHAVLARAGHHDRRRRSRPWASGRCASTPSSTCPPTSRPAELGVAARSAASIPDDEAVEVEGGTLADDSTNDLAAVVDEVRVAAGHRAQLHRPGRAVAGARGAGAADAVAHGGERAPRAGARPRLAARGELAGGCGRSVSPSR